MTRHFCKCTRTHIPTTISPQKKTKSPSKQCQHDVVVVVVSMLSPRFWGSLPSQDPFSANATVCSDFLPTDFVIFAGTTAPLGWCRGRYITGAMALLPRWLFVPGSLLIKYALTIAVLRSAYSIVGQTMRNLLCRSLRLRWATCVPATLISRLIFKFEWTIKQHMARSISRCCK